jgi:hypothetical protein
MKKILVTGYCLSIFLLNVNVCFCGEAELFFERQGDPNNPLGAYFRVDFTEYEWDISPFKPIKKITMETPNGKMWDFNCPVFDHAGGFVTNGFELDWDDFQQEITSGVYKINIYYNDDTTKSYLRNINIEFPDRAIFLNYNEGDTICMVSSYSWGVVQNVSQYHLDFKGSGVRLIVDLSTPRTSYKTYLPLNNGDSLRVRIRTDNILNQLDDNSIKVIFASENTYHFTIGDNACEIENKPEKKVIVIPMLMDP